MSPKPPDKFSLYVPDEQEPEKEMPVKLEVLDYNPARRRSRTVLRAGAYNPYEKDGGDAGDTARVKRPRADLRKLSEWIKLKQEVEQGQKATSDSGKMKKP
jgi:hypothetical protein